ncbi:hypothetical protein J2S09_002365 [Bacillus fengqiuensis]|nr:hypothetical protein [Bacillus fengqiuensis]
MSKNYRKFVAGTVTAAVVASAIAPAASAATFSDVDPASSHAEAIDALSEAGVINGYPDGTFKPGNSITRGQVAKMIARTIEGDGEVEQVFDDVPVTADEELVKAAQEVFEAGAITGANGKLMPANEITRQQMAKVLVEAFGLTHVEGAESQVTDLDKAYPDFREYIEVLSENGVTNVEEFRPLEKVSRAQFASFVYRALAVNVITEVAELEDIKVMEGEEVELPETVEVTYANDTTAEVAVEWDEVDTSKVGTQTVEGTIEGTDLKASVKVIVEAATPQVEEVSAINAKTIEVKFNKAVDAKTLKNASEENVITVVAGEGAVNAGLVSQELSADGKTLTLKAANIFKGEYTVKVPFEIVKDVTGKFVSALNQKVTVNDTTAPVLTSAESTVKDTKDGLKKITLTFDEEVSSIDTVKIGGSNYSAAVDGNKATVVVDLDATKTYDVTVVNATDAAGNVKDVQTASLNVVVDNIAPSITKVEATGENTVKVTLDKELKNDALSISGKVGTFATNVVTGAVVNPENKKEYNVTLNKNYLFKNGNSDTVTLTVAKDALVDSLGNTNAAEVTKTVVVAKDAIAPAVTKVETTATNGKVTAFTVTYNEEVTTADEAKISVVNSKGEILVPSNVVANAEVSATDAKTVVFTLANGLAADQYSFDLAEGFVQDKALSPNKSAKYAFTVDVTDAAKPVETSFTIVDATTTANVITVDFGAKVKATGNGSALNPSAYQVNGVALPSDSEITFVKDNGVVNQAKVEIKLPAGFVKANDDKAIFRVTGVQTLDNKVSAPFIKTIAITDNTAPEVQSIVATDLTKVTVTYSEAISIAADSIITDEITLVDSKGAKVDFSGYEVTTDGKLVLNVADASVVSKLTTLDVEDAAANIKDAANNAQKAGLTVSK